MVSLSTPSIVGPIIILSSFSLTGHAHYTLNETSFETGKFQPEIWLAASSNNASGAGRGLSSFSHFCLVVRDLC